MREVQCVGRRVTPAVLLLVMIAACSRQSVPPLPVVQSSTFLPSIRTEIDKALATARSRPDDPAAIGPLCRLLDAHDQSDAAAQCYARAQALDPKSFEWPYQLGSVRFSQGRYDDAVTAFRAALRIRQYTPASLNLAEALRETGKDEESFRLFQSLVAAEPENARAWYGLGRASERSGDFKNAEQSLRKACELYPTYGAAQYALGMLYQRQGRADLARTHLQAAEQHKAETPQLNDSLRADVRELARGTNVLLRRAAAFEKAGQIPEAIRENLAALEADKTLLQAHINLLSLYGRSGRSDEAEQHYRAALQLPGGKADAEYNYGVLEFHQGHLPEAARAFRRALSANPQHAPAHNNLGFVLEQQGKTREALAEYEAAIASQTDYRLAHFHAGRLLASQRQYRAAIDHLLKTIDPVDDSSPAYLYALSATYARAGQFKPALTYGERAREEAIARGQQQLLASIDRDLQMIKARGNRP